MLVMGMAAAGTASAAPLWLLCLEGTNANNTKYEDSSCTKAKSTGKFESVSAPTKDAVNIVAFTLTLKDTKTILGVSEVRCDSGGRASGTVGPGGKDEVTSAKVEEPEKNCRGLKVCGTKEKEIKEVSAVGLSWKTELEETEGKIQDKIEGAGTGGSGAGWKVICNTIGGEKEDKCEGEAGKPLELATLTNVVSKAVLLVLGEFLHRAKGKCTEGGAESGEVLGQFAILLANGGGLSVNPK
jgi:hypothetical protein